MDTLYYNAKVFTGRGENDFADAFRVSDGKFSWAGHLEGEPGPGAVDLRGRTVIPGLIESHAHAIIVSNTIGAVPCTIPLVHSIEEMISELRRHPNAGKGPNDWIAGWGYDESKLAEHRTPTRHDLDRVSRTQPVYVLRSDCHSGICNTRALELAGITARTPDPEIGCYGRDPDGTPNGVLFELEANASVRNAMENPDYENAVNLLVKLSGHYHERGYAAITEMMAKKSPVNNLDAFRDAAPRGLDLQACLYRVWAGGRDPHGMADLTEDEKKGRVKIAGIKLFADGSVSGRTAWVRDPYIDGTHGLCTLDVETLAAAYEYARRNRVQIAIHVMGDLSIQRIVDFFSDKEGWMESVPSVRLEHVTLITAEQLDQMERSRVNFGITTQVIFAFAEYESYVESMTPEVFSRIYPVRMIEKRMRDFALSSDAPATTWMDPDDPFVSIGAAVQRLAYNGKPINPDQSVPVGLALSLYTGRAAGLLPYEDPVGMIAPGYEANFNVLDRDLFTVEPGEIASVRVERAFLRGREVFARAREG